MLGGDLGAETTQNPNAKLQIKASHTVHGLLTHNSPNCSVLERKRKMRMSVTCRTGQGGICQEGRRLSGNSRGTRTGSWRGMVPWRTALDKPTQGPKFPCL